MTVNYSYKLTSDKPIQQSEEEVIIEAILENPGKWSKVYTLVAPVKQSGDFNLSFPFDLKQFTTIFDTIQQETGISASVQSLTLKATLHIKAQTDEGPINTTYVQSIKTNLRDGLLTWSGDMKKSEPGSIEVNREFVEQALIIGLPVLWWRIISGAIAIIMLTFLAYYFLRPSQGEAVRVERETRQLIQKYKKMIVEVKEWPEPKPGQTVLSLDTFQDLMKVAQGLLKPVHHKADNNKHIFWLDDDANRYEYLLADGMLKHEIQAKIAERLADTPDKTARSG